MMKNVLMSLGQGENGHWSSNVLFYNYYNKNLKPYLGSQILAIKVNVPLFDGQVLSSKRGKKKTIAL